MNLVKIPEQVRAAGASMVRRLKAIDGCLSHGWQAEIPEVGLAAVTSEGGGYKPGYQLWIIAASEREVFLGESCARTIIPEFTALDGSGCQRLVQTPRDFRFS